MIVVVENGVAYFLQRCTLRLRLLLLVQVLVHENLDAQPGDCFDWLSGSFCVTTTATTTSHEIDSVLHDIATYETIIFVTLYPCQYVYKFPSNRVQPVPLDNPDFICILVPE
jgi:hypothetical protein